MATASDPSDPTPVASTVAVSVDLSEVGADSDYVIDPVFGKQPKDVATQIKLQEKARVAASKAGESKDKATAEAEKAAQA